MSEFRVTPSPKVNEPEAKKPDVEAEKPKPADPNFGKKEPTPGVVGGMFFKVFKFVPENLTLEHVAELLTAMDIQFSEENFNKLSPKLKKQFIVVDRAGKPYRWGSRPK